MAPILQQQDGENGERLVARKKLYNHSSTLTTVTSTLSWNDGEDYCDYYDEEENVSKVKLLDPSGMVVQVEDHPHQKQERAACYRMCDLRYRVSTKPTEPWGHKPHPMLGASCFLFMLPIPFLSTCYPCTAALFGLTTLSSFLSDHYYSGLDSWAHVFDKTVAIMVFSFSLNVVYSTAGLWWALSSTLALACYVRGMEAVKRHDYHGFIFWHSMWHVVGVSLLVLIFALHGTRTECLV